MNSVGNDKNVSTSIYTISLNAFVNNLNLENKNNKFCKNVIRICISNPVNMCQKCKYIYHQNIIKHVTNQLKNNWIQQNTIKCKSNPNLLKKIFKLKSDDKSQNLKQTILKIKKYGKNPSLKHFEIPIRKIAQYKQLVNKAIVNDLSTSNTNKPNLFLNCYEPIKNKKKLNVICNCCKNIMFSTITNNSNTVLSSCPCFQKINNNECNNKNYRHSLELKNYNYSIPTQNYLQFKDQASELYKTKKE